MDARSDLDRWILSKLQHLVGKARGSFEEYRLHTFMGQVEQFVDDLSNWYLRRSRRRFWKSESDADKMAAYATLYETLHTLIRILAPILPFLTEEIYQNLVREVTPDAPASVHLAPYPEVEEERIDEDLEGRIDTVVRYKNAGRNLRQKSGIKVRQPLGRILVKTATEEEREALEQTDLRDQLLEELNVRDLELLETAKGLVETRARANLKTLGPRYGALLPSIREHIDRADPQRISEAIEEGSYTFTLGDREIEITAEDVEILHQGPEGMQILLDRDAVVALDTQITPGLEREGMARDLVRGIQNQRKALDLHVADRIEVRYGGDEAAVAAIEEWSEYIKRETLAVLLEMDDAIDPGAEGVTTVKAGSSRVHVRINLAHRDTR
jgi:isoleucyl-tRNA synthetase